MKSRRPLRFHARDRIPDNVLRYSRKLQISRTGSHRKSPRTAVSTPTPDLTHAAKLEQKLELGPLVKVLALFYRAPMRGAWSIADELRLSIVMGLRRGLRRVRGLRNVLNEDQQHIVAEAIVEHLRLSNWDIRPGSPPEGHAHLAGEAAETRDTAIEEPPHESD
jgi:hypothetical protein